MPSDVSLIVVVLVAAAVTVALRALPFAALSQLRGSRILPWLATRMPVGIMVILVVYSLHDLDVQAVDQVVPFALALVVTVGLHLWKHNAILSIVAGTLVCIGLSIAMG